MKKYLQNKKQKQVFGVARKEESVRKGQPVQKPLVIQFNNHTSNVLFSTKV